MDILKSTYFSLSDFFVTSTKYDNSISMDFLTFDHSKEIIDNILKMMVYLDLIRESFGFPIIVTSGFRTNQVNKEVGGVSNSKHLIGKACDITSKYLDSLFEIVQSYDFVDYSYIDKVKQYIHVQFK